MKIFDKDDNTLLTVLETAEATHEVELMKSDLVRLSWVDEEFYTLPAGTYIEPPFPNEVDPIGAKKKYYLYRDYTPEETSSGIKYTPEFMSPVMRQQYVPFYFETYDAEGKKIKKYEYPYVGRLNEILTMVLEQINTEFGYTSNKYELVTNESNKDLLEKTISVSFSDNDILSALAAITDAAECEYNLSWSNRKLYIDKNIVTVSTISSIHVGEEVNEPQVSKDKEMPYSRYVVFGSTRNMVRDTVNGNYISTGQRLTLDPDYYTDSIIDLRKKDTDDTKTPPDTTHPYSKNYPWKDGMENAPKTTGFLVFDDIYPHQDLYIYDLHERKKYKLDENGYPTTERWSVWYFKLAYQDANNNWVDYKLIRGDASSPNSIPNLTCQASEYVYYDYTGDTPDPDHGNGKKGVLTDMLYGDYFPSYKYKKGVIEMSQKIAAVWIGDSASHTYHMGVRKYNDKVMLCAFDKDCPLDDTFDDFCTQLGELESATKIRIMNADVSKAPEKNKESDMIDGLTPMIAFRINDNSGALESPLGTREFELAYNTNTVTFDAKDDVPGQTDIGAGYYEIIHTEEGEGLVMPTPSVMTVGSQSVQGICPKALSNGNRDKRNNKVFLYNVKPSTYSNMVQTAQKELLDAAKKAVDEMLDDGNTYTFKVNPVKEEKSTSTIFRVGAKVYFYLSDALKSNGTWDETKKRIGRILSVKTSLDYTFCKEITVGNTVQKGRYASLLSKVNGSGTSTGTGGSSSGSKANLLTEDDVEEIAKQYAYSGDCLTPLLFELHKAEGNTDTVIDPEEWESEIEADEEAREAAEKDGDDYETPLSIKSKYGHWTDYFLSALGIGSGGGGGGDTPLEWPLLQINAAGMSIDPSAGDTIVYDPNVTGHFKWGKAGGLSGLTLKDGDDTIIPTGTDESRTYDLGAKFLSLTHGGTVEGDIEIQGASLTITNRPQGFDPTTADNNVVLTKGETETFFNDKYVTVKFFEDLFKVYNGEATDNNRIRTNGTIPNPSTNVNIKAMFGFWTEQYLSALGKGNGGSGGGVSYLRMLGDVNISSPSNGDALVYQNGEWVNASSGIDTIELNSILATKKLRIKDGNTQLGNEWNASDGGDIDISGIFTGKKWWGANIDATTGKCEGDMTNVGDIAFSASGKNIGGLLYFNTTDSQVKAGSDDTVVKYGHGTTSAGAQRYVTPKLYVDGHFGVNGNVFAKAIELYTEKPYIDFHHDSSVNDYTMRIVEQEAMTSSDEHDHYYLNVRSDSGKTGLVVTNNSKGVDGDYIRIGGATITWDNTNKALHIDKGVYSDSFVSSLGTGSSGGGGGIDLEAMWHSLTNAQPTDAYASTKINNNHLNIGTLKIQIGSEEDEWDPTVTGQTVMTFTGGASGNYLPLSGGTMSNTNLVTNMNADLLDGLHANAFCHLYGGTNLVSSSNPADVHLDNLTTYGSYYCGNNANTQTYIKERPAAITKACRIEVGHWGTSSSYMYQRIRQLADSRVYERYYTQGTWSDWKLVQDDMSLYAKQTDIPEQYILPTASTSTLGGVKVGSGLSIDSSGMLSRDALTTSDIPDLSGTYVTNVAIGGYKWWGRSLNSSGEVTGTITVGNGNIVLNSDKYICSYDTPSEGGTATTRELLRLRYNNGVNAARLFLGPAQAGYTTLIYGNIIGFRYGTSGTTGMVINDSQGSGFVGIGTSSPTKKLDVNGDIHTSGEIYLDNAKNIYVTNMPATGETAAALEVLRLTSGNNMYLCRGTAEKEYSTSLYGNNIFFRYSSSGTIGMKLDTEGNVGIGTTSPAAKLDVNGQLKASAYLSCHNAEGTNRTAGWVKVATIDIKAASPSQPLKFRVTQRLRVGGELTVLFSHSSTAAETSVSEFFYTGDIVGAILVGGGSSYSLYIKKVGGTDKIGISLVDIGSYMNSRMTVTWEDAQYTETGNPVGTVATCRYYFAGDVYMEYDTTNKGVRVYNSGLYADTYVSSLGSGSTGQSGSTNLLPPLDAINGANLGLLTTGSVIMYTSSGWKYQTISGSGTVKSVNLSMPAGFSVSGGPVTDNGTLTVSFGTTAANANRVLGTNSSGVVSWRTLTEDDIPSLSADKITTGTFGNARISDVAWSKITGKPTNLEGYDIDDDDPLFAKITTGEASKLETTRKLWGNDFDGSEDIGTSLTSASLSHVGSISMDSTITGCTGMTVTANARISQASNDLYLGKSDNSGWVYLADCCSQTSSTNWALRNDGDARFLYVGINGVDKNYRLYVNGSIKATANSYFTALELSGNSDTKIPYIDFHKGGMVTGRDYSSRIRESADGVLTICAQALSNGSYVSSRAGLVVGENNNGDYIKIGGATLTWVEGQGLKIDTGVWSESFVSALGTGSGGSGGGIDTTNTAGVNRSNGTRLYLVGSKTYGTTGASDYDITYTSTKCYIGSDNCLYSNDSKVLTSGNTVTTDTTQTISGAKTFSASSTIVKGSLIVGGDNSLGLDAVLSTDNNDNLSITTGSDIYLKKNTAAQTKLTVGQASVNGSYNFYVNGTSCFFNTVGIGGYDSGYKLYVSGKAKVTGDFYAATDFMIRKVMNPDNSYYYTIGINQKTVSAQGTWQGTFTSGSDIRQKDVIENREISLEDIAHTPIFEFTWKDRRDTKVHLGTSAQYWDSKLPSVVYGQMENNLSMDYGATALAAAVMTARTVLTHEERIKALEAENKKLRKEIELLKAA